MIDVNEILNGPNKSKKKTKKNVFDMDRILPKQKEPKVDSVTSRNKDDEQKVIVHNHYYQMPPMQIPTMRYKKKKKSMRLTTLTGERAFDDDDNDGYPNYMDPQPKNPEVPRKKLIWEKTLRSIYRSDKDD